MEDYPEKIADERQLEELLSKPDYQTIELFKNMKGDLIFLGISGKIGPSLAYMAIRASAMAGERKKIYGVSRFSSSKELEMINAMGVETIRGDLLDKDFISGLPKVDNVFFLAGMKFGSEENLALTWAVNSYMPGLIAQHFSSSRIVAFSTGCVYPLVSVKSGGSTEEDHPDAIGEYAQSCLGRERLFEYGSNQNKTKVALIRLNYSVEMRYGVLVDIALKVWNHEPVDLTMGFFNVIWQGDSNNMILRSIALASSPAEIFNITGEEILSVRQVAIEFGKLFAAEPKFTGKESETALLSNSRKAYKQLGYPKVPVEQVIRWIAFWIRENKPLLGKPTHYEVRDGHY